MDLSNLLPLLSSEKDVDSVEISMRRAENGYVVEVDYPKDMLTNPSAEKAKDIFSSLSKMVSQGEKDTGDPTDMLKRLNDVVSNITKPPGKPLRKAHEEYVFGEIEGALKFIRETFDMAEKD